MTIKQTLLLLAIAGFGLASCQSKTAAPPAADTTKTVSGEPEDKITFDEARQYVELFGLTRATEVDSISKDGKIHKLPNSRTVWFTKAKLEAMLKNLNDEKGDGVRFYFASYPSKVGKPNGGTPDPKYAGYNTLVMVSTIEKDTLGQKLHWDSYSQPNANGTGGRGIIIGSGPENRGEMCPPPRDCPTIGATLIQ